MNATEPDALLRWRPEQLEDDRLDDAPSDLASTPEVGPGTQYHRNFFVVLFDRDGRTTVNRRAFIVDRDDDGDGRKSLQIWTGRQVDFWITMDHYGKLRLVD